jgi:hypothetical protein
MSRFIRSVVMSCVLASGAFVALDANAATSRALNLNSPSAMAVSGSTLWIVEQGSSSLLALNALTGAYQSKVGPASLKIASPDAIVFHGPRMYVSAVGGRVGYNGSTGIEIHTTNPKGCAKATTKLAGSAAGLIELCSNGTVNLLNYQTLALVKTASPAKTSLSNATSMLVIKSNLFVTNSSNSTSPDEIVEFSLPSLTKVRIISNKTQPLLALSAPMGIGSDGTDLWVTNSGNDSLTEISLAKLMFVAVVSADHSYNLWGPHDVLTTVSAGVPTIYVTNVDGPTSSMVTRFTSTSALSQSFNWTMCNTNDVYTFDDPSGIALFHNVLWVVNRSNGALDQMDATTGALTHVFT